MRTAFEHHAAEWATSISLTKRKWFIPSAPNVLVEVNGEVIVEVVSVVSWLCILSMAETRQNETYKVVVAKHVTWRDAALLPAHACLDNNLGTYQYSSLALASGHSLCSDRYQYQMGEAFC